MVVETNVMADSGYVREKTRKVCVSRLYKAIRMSQVSAYPYAYQAAVSER